MGDLEHSVASLRVMGDDLRPEEISQLLGKEPSYSQTRGEVLVGRKTGFQRTAEFGMWRLEAQERRPGDLDAQVLEILAQLTNDLGIWKQLTERYVMDIFCGAFMKRTNDGITFQANTLLQLGSRGIDLDLDIYGGTDEDDDDTAC